MFLPQLDRVRTRALLCARSSQRFPCTVRDENHGVKFLLGEEESVPRDHCRGKTTQCDIHRCLFFFPLGYQLNSAECVDIRLKRVVPDHYCHYYPENVKPKPKLKECSMDPCPSRSASLPLVFTLKRNQPTATKTSPSLQSDICIVRP